MKRLYEILQLNLISSMDIDKYLIGREYAQEDVYSGRFKYLTDSIENLKTIKPVENNHVIFCLYDKQIDYNFDENNKLILDEQTISNTFIIYSKDSQDKIIEDIEHYSLSIFQSIEKLLGAYIFIEPNSEYSIQHGLLSIIEEICYLGNTESQIQEGNRNLEKFLSPKKIEISHECSEALAFEELIEKGFPDKTDPYYIYLKEEMKMYNLHKNEISKALSDISEQNSKKNDELLMNMFRSEGYKIFLKKNHC